MRPALALLLVAAAGAGVLLWSRRSSSAAPAGGIWGQLNEGPGSSPFLPGPEPDPSPSPFDWLIDMTKPRGIRNQNPGNVRISPSQWLGKVPVAQNTDGKFEQFTKPLYGLRVIAYLLLKYQRDKGKRTIRALIEEPGGWAPSNTDANPASYGDTVAAALGIRETDLVDLFAPNDLLQKMVAAIVQFENGQQPYTPALIAEACRMARSAVG